MVLMEQEKEKLQKYTDQINDLREKDQSLRKIMDMKDNPTEEEWKAIGEFDAESTKVMKQIVTEIGLPTISKVGESASYSAWLVVQHSPDLEFQKEYLRLLKENKADVNPQNIAYLEDRVLMYEGKPQIYGTQLRLNKETQKYEPYETVDIENVNTRRKEVGLETIEEYLSDIKD